jgi:glycosyltransferase involved in cell wall biosynthesis
LISKDDFPLVSVIIPVYNAEMFIEEAITSIFIQTYTNIEIIAIDDASTDSSFSVLESLCKIDTRLKIYQNATNCGICKTLNRALEIARGDYIARMDADDVAFPERIERQIEFLFNHPECSLVGVSNNFMDTEGNILSMSSFPCTYKEVDQTILLSSPVSHNWVCAISVYKQLGGYRDMAPVEDYDFLLRLKSNEMKFVNIPYCGMKIRQTNSGITAASGLRQKLAYNYAIKLYKDRAESGGADDFSRENFLKSIKSNKIMYKLYELATDFHMRAIKYKKQSTLLAFALITISVIISPHQFQYFMRRLLLKVILSFYKFKSAIISRMGFRT